MRQRKRETERKKKKDETPDDSGRTGQDEARSRHVIVLTHLRSGDLINKEQQGKRQHVHGRLRYPLLEAPNFDLGLDLATRNSTLRVLVRQWLLPPPTRLHRWLVLCKLRSTLYTAYRRVGNRVLARG